MDRNQATGLILISVMLLLYFSFFGGQPDVPQNTTTDSTAQTTENNQPEALDQASPDIITTLDAAIEPPNEVLDTTEASAIKEEFIEIENDDIRIVFSSIGARVREVELKKYLTYDKEPLILLDENSSSTSLLANNAGRQIDLMKIPYSVNRKTVRDTTVLTFSMTNANGGRFEQIYEIPPTGYLVDYKIRANGMDYMLGSDLSYGWINNMKSLEMKAEISRQKASVNYYTGDGSFEELGERSTDLETADAGDVKWLAFKQQFFTIAFIADSKFTRLSATQEVKESYVNVTKFTSAMVGISADEIKLGKADYQLFFGPNSYPLFKKVAPDFEKNIYLGWPPVNLVNKWVIIPIFNWLKQYFANFGIIIIILVFIIKLALSPLSYKSYISMAKMKVMKPELDELKEKTGGDQQKFQSEQMKLYQQVGVNPLSGCIPMVLQMPILFAMFYFFPGSIELRQEPFLWANDLSTYDSIATLPFTIPIYGDHVSLFVLLMTASTILYTWSNNQMSTVQGPMKSMSYMMPVIFMFVLNSFPASLSFYYFVSNIITFGQQAIIRKFVNEDKIKAILDENRTKNKGKKKSKFQERLDRAMEASKEAQKKKKK
jgi:YidC/Oxa1 family membrane protein insertase